MKLIRADKVIKRNSENFNLGPISLSLSAGQILGIAGNRGAGKTTLLRLLWGFLRPDRGTVSVFHLQPHLNQLSVRRHAGYLSKCQNFNRPITVRQHLEFASHFYEGWNQAFANSLLGLFDIEPETLVEELCGEAKIKLALISAVGHNPFLLLLDDPMAGLNSELRQEISIFLKLLVKNRGTGIVLSSQQPGDLNHLPDSILILDDGKISGQCRDFVGH